MTSLAHYSLRFFYYLTFPKGWRQLWREGYRRWFLFWSSVKFVVLAEDRVDGRTIEMIFQSSSVATGSLDNSHPKGALLNLTNRGFLLAVERELAKCPFCRPRFLDLGCGGGQLVRDAFALGWAVAGVDGCSAASRKFREAFLYGADITEGIEFKEKFNLVTMWEVLEHIPDGCLPMVFLNVVDNMEKGGVFIASTNSEPDMHEGVDLHVTKWSNEQWKSWIADNVPELKPIKLNLSVYEYARQCLKNPSFLTYERL